MMTSSILSGLQVSTTNEMFALRRIQTYSFIVVLLNTGERNQLKNTRFTLPLRLRKSLHVDSDRPPSNPKNTNALIQPLFRLFIRLFIKVLQLKLEITVNIHSQETLKCKNIHSLHASNIDLSHLQQSTSTFTCSSSYRLRCLSSLCPSD